LNLGTKLLCKNKMAAMETGPQASFCWYCAGTFSVDVTYRQHLAQYHKMAPRAIEEITSSGDVNRVSPIPAAPPKEATSSGAKESPEPPKAHDSDIEIMPGLHQSFHNEASSAESEAEDTKPTGLDLHKALDVDARFDKWLAGSCKYKCAICEKIFNSSIRFWNHIENGHKVHYLKYREEHPEKHCVEKHMIECALCNGNRVEHDKGKLLRHFRKSHPGQDIKEYFLHYVERGGQSVEKMVVEPDVHLPDGDGEVSSSVEDSFTEQSSYVPNEPRGLKRKLEADTEVPSSRPKLDNTPDTQSAILSTSGIQSHVPATANLSEEVTGKRLEEITDAVRPFLRSYLGRHLRGHPFRGRQETLPGSWQGEGRDSVIVGT